MGVCDIQPGLVVYAYPIYDLYRDNHVEVLLITNLHIKLPNLMYQLLTKLEAMCTNSVFMFCVCVFAIRIAYFLIYRWNFPRIKIQNIPLKLTRSYAVTQITT